MAVAFIATITESNLLLQRLAGEAGATIRKLWRIGPNLRTG